MNPDLLLQSVQKGFRATLGATATLAEGIQEPQKLQQTFTSLSSDFGKTVDEWAQKGEVTENEIRSVIERLLAQGNKKDVVNQPNATPASPEIQQELQELTAKIAAIRKELEELRD